MRLNFYLFVTILLITYCIPCICKKKAEDPGVFETIRSGFQMAGKMLGLDRAAAIARLVSQTFAKQTNEDKEPETQGASMFKGLFRLLGLQGAKIGALAINTIIFLAQLLSSSLLPEGTLTLMANEPRTNGNSPLNLILDTSSRGASRLLNIATDRSLPDKIIQLVGSRYTEENISCIKLLLCKSAPFVWKMQEAIKNKEDSNKPGTTTRKKVTATAALFQYLPTLQEFEKRSEECEQTHGIC